MNLLTLKLIEDRRRKIRMETGHDAWKLDFYETI